VITPDSSVAIAAAASWHVAHENAVAALERDEVALIAHVAYETTAALSRMPQGHRIAPAIVLEWLERRFESEWLTLPPTAERHPSIGHSASRSGMWRPVHERQRAKFEKRAKGSAARCR
jgi:predicted nucleic acid-binding protein